MRRCRWKEQAEKVGRVPELGQPEGEQLVGEPQAGLQPPKPHKGGALLGITARRTHWRMLFKVGFPQLLGLQTPPRVWLPRKMYRRSHSHSGKNPMERIPQSWPQRSSQLPGKGQILGTLGWPMSRFLEAPLPHEGTGFGGLWVLPRSPVNVPRVGSENPALTTCLLVSLSVQWVGSTFPRKPALRA